MDETTMLEVIAHIVEPTNCWQIITTIGSLVLSVGAIIVSIITYKSQVIHNKNSIRPILDIIVGDYEDDIHAKIVNNGVGPATIKSVLCSNGQRQEECLYKLVPTILEYDDSGQIHTATLDSFTDFVEEISGRTIAPGDSITLLQLKLEDKDEDKEKLIALRIVLRDIKVEVDYENIYNDSFKVSRQLDFFGRTLSDDIEVIFTSEECQEIV